MFNLQKFEYEYELFFNNFVTKSIKSCFLHKIFVIKLIRDIIFNKDSLIK
jgi:hypothetical protein